MRKRAMRRRVGISDDGGFGSYCPYVYNPWRGGLSREGKSGVLGDKKAVRGNRTALERSGRREPMALVGRLVLVAIIAAWRWLVVVVARLWWGLIAVVVLIVTLILGIADYAAADAACGCADGCAFKAAARLIADDAADSRAAEGAEDGTGLGVGATGTGCQGGTAQEDEDFVFHGMISGLGVVDEEPPRCREDIR